MKFHDHTPLTRLVKTRTLKHHDRTPTELAAPMSIGGLAAPRYDKGYIDILTHCPTGTRLLMITSSVRIQKVMQSDSRLEEAQLRARPLES
jgi:hypothetical protein